ncbi:YHS domain-containing (seleno)protein [Planctobacterium marinum]|uniref:YHS domain-containing (seleno)protein n=1 Tax=Planctobacterium marinum TaxID=1631968 RepID=UPI001E3EB29A|nr:YHS domain-containing (seleno)protein [Planctobacterium marinum]MCC2604854.1 YHS domain-containing protein [Planctobacterium marinum]
MIRIVSTLFALFVSLNTLAGIDTQTDDNGVILAGHDAVAYFTDNKPVMGKAEFTAVYQGAIYRFSSAENRNTFNQNPQQYAPAYGGYCSTCTSFGKKFEVNGKAFKIVDGQLFVNKNEEIHAFWLKDVAGNIVKADNNWPEIKHVPADEL